VRSAHRFQIQTDSNFSHVLLLVVTCPILAITCIDRNLTKCKNIFDTCNG